MRAATDEPLFYVVQMRDDDGDWIDVQSYLMLEDAEAKADQGARLGEVVRIVSRENTVDVPLSPKVTQ